MTAMGTNELLEPNGAILYEGPHPDQYRKFLADAHVLLRRCVAFCTHVIGWCDTTGGDYYRAAPVLMLRHIVEETDAISVLVSNGVTDAIRSHLRSMLEARLGLEYSLDTDQKNRGMAYFVAHIHAQIATCQRMDPSTSQGKQFRAAWKKDAALVLQSRFTFCR